MLGATSRGVFRRLIALLVVCTACANVSSIILAQTTTRGREFAVRAALGASRVQQMRHLLVESLGISVLAGALGIALAWGGILVMRHAGVGSGGFDDVELNVRVLAAGIIVALATPLGFALLPAWRLSKTRIDELRIGHRGTETPKARRLREALVVLQVAFVLVLVTQVALVARTTWRLYYSEKGLDPQKVRRCASICRRMATGSGRIRFRRACPRQSARCQAWCQRPLCRRCQLPTVRIQCSLRSRAGRCRHPSHGRRERVRRLAPNTCGRWPFR